MLNSSSIILRDADDNAPAVNRFTIEIPRDLASRCDQHVELTKFRMGKPVEVNLGDPIRIETGQTAIPAVVTLILETSCEALYIDDAGKVLAEEVQWLDVPCDSSTSRPGFDAESLGRLRPFIVNLRGKSRG